ncbi:MAG: hypothetical protein HYZ28_02665 [Myxococcales bacterium]|nr:hypothetical protein [Myxococcales bacterium]
MMTAMPMSMQAPMMNPPMPGMMMPPMMGMGMPMMGMGMGMPMQMPMMGMPAMMPMMMRMMPVMTRMTCEMSKEGLVCKMMPMEGQSMDTLRECCEAINAMMAMGAPCMLVCNGMPMAMGTPK